MREIYVDGETLTIDDVVSVARNEARIVIPEQAKKRVDKSRKTLSDLLAKGEVIYGVNTGFGALSNTEISSQKSKQLQSNLIRSHSAGVGEQLATEVVRSMMLLRVNTLVKGYSGIRWKTIETLAKMLNRGVHPIIPAKGSVGASGDLAPLSHMVLVLMGEGEAEYKGVVTSGKEAMERADIETVQLGFKEGIALNNGTQLMTGIATLALDDAENLIKTAEIATALTLEVLMGVSDAFDEKIQRAKPHRGQEVTASNIRRLVEGSKLVSTGREAMERAGRPHDPYSLRCAPQILGTVRDSFEHIKSIVEIELNSATDNPLVFPETMTCLSGGNFHGQPISLTMDLLGMSLAIIGNLSERRTARLIDENQNNELPAFLISPRAEKGLNSGLMTVQYTAAALASENKILAHPACVDTIPTSAGFEDFVSMGVTAALKSTKILENVEYIVAIELLCAAQAADFRGPEKLGKGSKLAYQAIREILPHVERDRVISKDIENIREKIKEHAFANRIEQNATIR